VGFDIDRYYLDVARNQLTSCADEDGPPRQALGLD
jgi:hypothetical protein